MTNLFELFESNLAYLIISGLINIDDCYKNNNFDPNYLRGLLEKYKKQALKPFKEYDYDENRNSASEVLENGKRIILPYISDDVKRIM